MMRGGDYNQSQYIFSLKRYFFNKPSEIIWTLIFTVKFSRKFLNKLRDEPCSKLSKECRLGDISDCRHDNHGVYGR